MCVKNPIDFYWYAYKNPLDLYWYAYILDGVTVFLLQAGFRKACFRVLHSHLFLLKMQ